MSRNIIIGRNGDQPFPIADNKVSSHHALLFIDDKGGMTLSDNQSTNGTFIFNGNTFTRIPPKQPVRVSPDTMVQLGPETRFHLRRLLVNKAAGRAPEPEKKKPEPKTVDISHLRGVSDQYNARKVELESKMASANGLRSMTILVALLAGTASSALTTLFDVDINSSSGKILMGVIGVVVAAVLIVILMSIANNKVKKVIIERQENEQRYSVNYCCPVCKLSFKGKFYENVISEGACPRCKSKFVEAPMGQMPGSMHGPNTMPGQMRR